MYLAHGANERLFLFALTELPCAPEQPGRATRDYNRKTPWFAMATFMQRP